MKSQAGEAGLLEAIARSIGGKVTKNKSVRTRSTGLRHNWIWIEG